ncbi:MAG: roadblock/LC7 domain-containing protein [Planctomycetes bacterium]|nr:roadblock/LC7 domain-containing protein [Planctomycetota bacterium]
MVSDNEALRLRRLVFYAADIDKINAVLLAFVKKANAQSTLLIDQEGHMVARQGFQQNHDSSALAALVAGSFASTREVARLLGEKEFRVLFHQGAGQSIHITLLGERTLQVAVFASTIKSGMIHVLCKELAVQLEVLLADAAKRAPEQAQQTLGAGFSEAMKDQLDSLFGNL